MLRGLAIRRLFFLLDLILVVAVIGAAVFQVKRVFSENGRQAAAISVGADGVTDAAAMLHVASLKEYALIEKQGLFGDAGRFSQETKPEPAPEPVQETREETELPLKLWGTAAAEGKPKDPLASAVIENQKDNTIRTFAVNEEIIPASPKVVLLEVRQRAVLINNDGTEEWLSTEEARLEAAQVASAGGPGSGDDRGGKSSSDSRSQSKFEPQNTVTLNKAEVIQELFMNYSELIRTIRPTMYKDESGNVAGITAENLESIPLANMLGVKDGDVLQTVNNEVIDSQQKVLEIVNKYRNANVFRVGILRDGKPSVITYRLQ